MLCGLRPVIKRTASFFELQFVPLWLRNFCVIISRWPGLLPNQNLLAIEIDKYLLDFVWQIVSWKSFPPTFSPHVENCLYFGKGNPYNLLSIRGWKVGFRDFFKSTIFWSFACVEYYFRVLEASCTVPSMKSVMKCNLSARQILFY